MQLQSGEWSCLQQSIRSPLSCSLCGRPPAHLAPAAKLRRGEMVKVENNEIKLKNGIRDACSTSDILDCPRHAKDLPRCPRWCPDIPQMMLQTSPGWCPRHAPDDAADMPQMMLQTYPRWYHRHAPDDATDMPQKWRKRRERELHGKERELHVVRDWQCLLRSR